MSNVAIVMTEEELDARIEQRVAAVLAKLGPVQQKENLTMSDVCELLGVSRKTVGGYIKNDGMPAIPIGKREHRFSRAKVLEWWHARERSNR